MKFKDLKLKEEIQKAIEDLGFVDSTDIQSQAIPAALEDRDVLGQAQTGTGKTIAFVLPILEKVKEDDSLQALILAPTRELAIQITTEINKLTKYLNIKTVTLYGGDPIDKQIKLLKNKPQIVVGTPGRVLDMINRKKLKLHEINFFVLDEVDEMLNMGFIEDVETIEAKMPRDKQILLFSATLAQKIKKLCDNFLNDPVKIKVDAKSLTVDKVDQHYIIVKNKQKASVLENLLLLRKEQKIIIFTQTKRACDEIYDFLKEKKYRVGKIHGDIVQKQRTDTMENFRLNKFDILIASDVVARGIDINGIDLVINYELPQDIEYYIHRIGRTGRGNAKKGEAITLVTPNIYNNEFRFYEKDLKCTITEMKRPSLKEVQKELKEKYLIELQDKIFNEEIADIYYDMTSDIHYDIPHNIVITYLLSKLYPELSKEKEDTVEISSSSRGGNSRKKKSNSSGSHNRRRNGTQNGNKNRNRNNNQRRNRK